MAVEQEQEQTYHPNPLRLNPRHAAVPRHVLAGTNLALLLLAPTVLAQSSTIPPPSVINPYTQVAPGVNGLSGTNSLNPGNLGEISAFPSQQGSNVAQAISLPGPTVLYPDPTQYVLTPGDLINIRLFGSTDYVTTQRISKDGTVELPLVGSIILNSLTIRAAEDAINDRLRAAGMYRNPQIVITVAESASPLTITLAGEMHGLFPIQGQRPLIDVLASFGGLPTTAGRTITIIRPGMETPIMVDLGTTPQDLLRANIPILPHDIIFVERAGAVYVVGAFKIQGAFPLPAGRLTLMQLTALSGGALFAGRYDDLRVIRITGTSRTELKFDIKKILYGKDPDPTLQAGDIVFLPPQPIKAALANGNFNSLISVLSLLVLATRN